MIELAADSPAEPSAYLQVWAESLGQVLSQIAGTPQACLLLTDAPTELAAAGEGDFWAIYTCTGALRGEMSVRLNPASGLGLAKIFVDASASTESATAEEATFGSQQREAVLELLRQVAGVVTTSAKARWGEIQLRLDTAPGAASWPASSTGWLQVGEAGAAALLAEFHISAALAATLRAEKAEAGKSAADPSASTSPNANSPNSASSNLTSPNLTSPNLNSSHASSSNRDLGALDPQTQEGKLELLMDVELAMTLHFGSRRLLLREILDLGPGSVIELDRQVQDPVDMLLDGKLVARGEVVLMDGNYGLRVTEVLASAGIAE